MWKIIQSATGHRRCVKGVNVTATLPNFFQDFPRLPLKGRPVLDNPVSVIIEAIVSDEVSEYSSARHPSREDYRRSQEFWELVEKFET